MTHPELVLEPLKHVPESVAADVLDFAQFLEQEQECTGIRQPRHPGSARGQVCVAEDFDAPLGDFKGHQ